MKNLNIPRYARPYIGGKDGAIPFFEKLEHLNVSKQCWIIFSNNLDKSDIVSKHSNAPTEKKWGWRHLCPLSMDPMDLQSADSQ